MDEEMLKRLRADQQDARDFCAGLTGLTVAAATDLAQQRGYDVRSAILGSNAVFTADMRSDRVNLYLSVDGVVICADVG